ncbi:hypothetical protein [Vibrio jasicida]|uniref:hypothetical protein n=1 Tax=Vibrio jasicida TaxID=766224 RepID=UPI001641E000|nr:hypothetical protein [Vibrio jasicida]
MSLSHLHMNDKQIKLASSAALTAAMETVAKRYTGDVDATTNFLIETSSDTKQAGGVQTGAVRFNWTGAKGAALIRILEQASTTKLNLKTLTTAEHMNRLTGILRSVGAHQLDGRKTIAKHANINEQLLSRNMETISMLAYYKKLMHERSIKLQAERNKEATALTDEYQALSLKMQQGKALPIDIKRLVTVSQLINEMPLVMFEPVTAKEA